VEAEFDRRRDRAGAQVPHIDLGADIGALGVRRQARTGRQAQAVGRHLHRHAAVEHQLRVIAFQQVECLAARDEHLARVALVRTGQRAQMDAFLEQVGVERRRLVVGRQHLVVHLDLAHGTALVVDHDAIHVLAIGVAADDALDDRQHAVNCRAVGAGLDFGVDHDQRSRGWSGSAASP